MSYNKSDTKWCPFIQKSFWTYIDIVLVMTAAERESVAFDQLLEERSKKNEFSINNGFPVQDND